MCERLRGSRRRGNRANPRYTAIGTVKATPRRHCFRWSIWTGPPGRRRGNSRARFGCLQQAIGVFFIRRHQKLYADPCAFQAKVAGLHIDVSAQLGDLKLQSPGAEFDGIVKFCARCPRLKLAPRPSQAEAPGHATRSATIDFTLAVPRLLKALRAKSIADWRQIAAADTVFRGWCCRPTVPPTDFRILS